MSNAPIKVLNVLGRRPIGGVGSFLLNMHSNINTNKVQFDYLICSDDFSGEFDEKVKKLGGNVFIVPELKYKNAYMYLNQLCSFYKKHHEYKVVHVHSVNIGLFNFLLAKKYGILYRIAHSHNTKYSDGFIKSIRNYILQLPLRYLSNVYVACGKQAATFLFGTRPVEDNKVYIAKNAIITQQFKFSTHTREQLRNLMNFNDNFVVGHVGSFSYQKNHLAIIEIFNELYKINKKAVLVLVGSGELETAVKLRVETLNIQDVVYFLGNRKDVNVLMQTFDVFVLPSRFEGFPLVGLEAQAAGLPCFFSDRITKELQITDKVKFKSIDGDFAEDWANELNKSSNKNEDRINAYCKVIEAGYDVNLAAQQLQEFYLKL